MSIVPYLVTIYYARLLIYDRATQRTDETWLFLIRFARVIKSMRSEHRSTIGDVFRHTLWRFKANVRNFAPLSTGKFICSSVRVRAINTWNRAMQFRKNVDESAGLANGFVIHARYLEQHW